ncbi:MAG: hypothetical protein WCZ89_06940 [Phycisphaerae bacterium]
MGKLSNPQILEYFDKHLLYRNQILLAHKKLCDKGSYEGDPAILNACFEASLITGRMYLNVLGISKNKHDILIRNLFRDDDVTAEDLGGKLVDISKIPHTDRDLFVGFLKMADKGAAHLTLPNKHPWERTHKAIDSIVYYLEKYLYIPSGRSSPFNTKGCPKKLI